MPVVRHHHFGRPSALTDEHKYKRSVVMVQKQFRGRLVRRDLSASGMNYAAFKEEESRWKNRTEESFMGAGNMLQLVAQNRKVEANKKRLQIKSRRPQNKRSTLGLFGLGVPRHSMTNKSLWIFAPQNEHRLMCIYISSHSYFNWFIMFIILLNCVFICLGDPLCQKLESVSEVRFQCGETEANLFKARELACFNFNCPFLSWRLGFLCLTCPVHVHWSSSPMSMLR